MLSAAATKVLATCVLGTTGAGLVAWVAIWIYRFPYRSIQKPLFAWSFLMARLLWRVRVGGRLPVPPGQGAVIVCNHHGPIDPSFIALAADRLVHWMVAREYTQHGVVGWFMRTCEVIPVSRGGIDTAATKQAIRYAQNGGLVGVFPEGRINTTDQTLLPGRPGAAMIALRARVPIIPCYATGSPNDGTTLGCLLMPAKVRLQVGRPIDVSPYYGREGEREVLEHLTRRLLSEMARLAGEPDFEPQLAGRFYKPGRSRN